MKNRFKTLFYFFTFTISSCATEPSPLDIYISQTDKIYKNLVKDAKVEDSSEEEYLNAKSQQDSLAANANGNITQKVIDANLGLKIIYQKIETNGKKQFRKVTGTTDNDLQKRIALITIVGLKCYNYSKKLMDEECKNSEIDKILKDKSNLNSEELKAKVEPKVMIVKKTPIALSVIKTTNIQGMVWDEIGNKVPNAEIIVQSEDRITKIFSNNDGIFSLDLPMNSKYLNIDFSKDDKKGSYSTQITKNPINLRFK